MPHSDLTEFLLSALPTIRRVAIGVLGADNAMLDDAIQEAVIKVWRFRHRFTGGNLDAWITTVTKNACHDVRLSPIYRHLHGNVCHDTLHHTHGHDDTVTTVLRNDDQRMVREAIGKLSATYRDVAWLVYVEGYKVREVVDALGLSSVTAHGRARDAKVILAKMLTKEREVINNGCTNSSVEP